MDNQGVADLLYELADFSELLDEVWEARAYRKAARQIELLARDINKVRDFKTIPGVGEGISKKISEFLETGKSSALMRLKKSVPVDYEELRRIEGLGPKRIKVLYNELGVKGVSDLKSALKSGKVGELEGFGKKLVSEILQGIGFLKSYKGRFLLGDVYERVHDIIERLLKVKGVSRVEVCGSVRRMCETVHDADLLACSSNPEPVMNVFTSLRGVKKVFGKGDTKSSVLLSDGFQVDLRVVPKKSFGAAMNYFIGSKAHNIALRKMAIGKGLKLSEYGLFKHGKMIAGSSEKSVYKKLGLSYVEPEMRENIGEIELSKKGRLPKLVSSLKGDLQMHSRWSDGFNSIQELGDECKRLGHKYFGVSDHAGSLKVANAIPAKRVKNYLSELEIFNALKGVEVDIDSRGKLSLPDSLLAEFDYVIASVHSGFKQSGERMTERLLKAFESRVSILAHPTGRLIGKREGFSFDFDKVFSRAAELGVLLEVNSQPERLDLSPELIRRAKSFNCKFVVNTDAHTVNQLSYLNFGLGAARRGWLESGDVVNSFSLARLKKFLR